MKRAIAYLYYKFDKSNSGAGDAVTAIQFCAIIILHLMPLVWICDALFKTYIFESFINLVQNDNVWLRRLVLIPLAILPMYIFIYFLLRHNKAKLSEGYREIESLSVPEKKRKDVLYVTYLIGTYIFLILGLVSPSWIAWIRSW